MNKLTYTRHYDSQLNMIESINQIAKLLVQDRLDFPILQDFGLKTISINNTLLNKHKFGKKSAQT